MSNHRITQAPKHHFPSLTINHWQLTIGNLLIGWIKGTTLKTRLPILALILLLISGCTGPEAHLWLDAPGWGLGKIVTTTTIDQPVQIVGDENGRLYLFTLSPSLQPTIVALNVDGTVHWQTSLADSFPRLDAPRLFWQNGQLTLFWQQRTAASTASPQAVYAATLSDDGEIITQAASLVEEPNLASYDVALLSDGGVALWWGGTRRLPGVWATTLTDFATPAIFTPIDAEGLQPAIQLDASNTLHASWHQLQLLGSRTVTHFYTTLPAGNPQQAAATILLAEEPLRDGSLIEGPFLSIINDQVNIIWTESLRSGRGAGNGRTVAVQFPLGEPQPQEPAFVRLPAFGQPYVAAPAGVKVGPRILPSARDEQFGRSPAQMVFADQNGPEMSFAIPQQISQGRLLVSQIGLGYLRNGQSKGVQLLTQANTSSFRPSVYASSDNHLYVSWLRRMQPEGFAVYLASSEPALQAALSQLGGVDYSRMASATVTSLLQGSVFTPFAFLFWMLVPMLLFILTIPLRRNAIKFQDRPVQLSVGMGLIAYLIVKIVTTQGIWGYQPFSSSIPILPDGLGIFLQILIPLASLIISWRIAHRLTERSETESAVFFTAIFVAVDSLITMTIYGDVLLSLL